jgi:hypothetical protein
MKRLPALLLYACTICCTNYSQAQDRTEIGTLAADYVNHIRAAGTEKAFVHTNRWTFAAGDSIWLKAYCINSATHQYMASSKTMYVDLVDDQDSVIKFLLLDIPSQQTDAALPIPNNLAGGQYWLRAYTQRMLAGDSSGIFVQPVYISNPQLTRATTGAKTSIRQTIPAKPLLQVVTEGGALISGFDNTIAIATTDETGKPVSRSGFIKDSRDSIVARFTSNANGLGKLSFVPWRNRKYTAWLENAGQKMSVPLPAIDPNAASIIVSKQTPASFHLTIALGDSLYERKPTTRLLLLQRDRLLYAANGKGMYELDIPTARFPEGKVSVLLLNTDGKLLSERAVYCSAQPYLQLQTDKPAYRHKEKAVLSILAADTVQHNDAVRLSLAVASRNKTEMATEGMLVDKLIHDNIELPVTDMRIGNFDANDQDIIMLLQRPAFLNATKTTTATAADQKPEPVFTNVSGTVRDKKNMIAPGKVIVLKIPGNNQLLYTETADSAGRFRFSIPENIHDADITLELAEDRAQKGEFFIIPDHLAMPVFTTPLRLKMQFSAQDLKDLKSAGGRIASTVPDDGQQLQNVDVVSLSKKPAVEFANRYSSLSQIIVFSEKDKDDPMAARSLVMRAPGVSLRDGFLMINGGPNSTTMPSVNDEPLVVMDGAPMSTAGASRSSNESSPVLSLLTNLPAGSIDYIEILSGPSAAAFGERGANGVIAINSNRNGRTSQNSSGKRAVSYHYQGYASQPHFTEPDYSKKAARAAGPDKRSTIAWNGDILTQKSARYQLPFYTGDSFAEYRITVFGLSPKGDIIYQQVPLLVSGN